jgi:hypothetical protein
MKLLNRTVSVIIMSWVLAFSPLCSAQADDATLDSAPGDQASVNSAIEVARANSRAERANIISAAMKFSDNDAAAFWPIYRQYEYERTALDDGRVEVIKEYTQKNASLTDAEAKSMAQRMFAYDSGLVTLKKKYFKKFSKVLPAFTVTKFFQLDRRVDLLQDMNVESMLPPLTVSRSVTVETNTVTSHKLASRR